MLETLDYTIRIGSIPTFLYFDLYLYSAYAAHFVYIPGRCTDARLIMHQRPPAVLRRKSNRTRCRQRTGTFTMRVLPFIKKGLIST